MELRCIIGSQGFVGGPTYSYGDVYELNDEETAKRLIKAGYAEEIATIVPSVTSSPLVGSNKKPTIKSNISKSVKAKRNY